MAAADGLAIADSNPMVGNKLIWRLKTAEEAIRIFKRKREDDQWSSGIPARRKNGLRH